MKKELICFFVLILILIPGINAATINAASPELTDVQAAINAANPGDTVLVPAGSVTWNNQLVIRKGINLIGAGIGNTIITSNYTGTGWSTDVSRYLVIYWPQYPANNEPFRLSGFTFDLNGKCGGVFFVNTAAAYPVNKIRIDHTRIINTGGRPFVLHGPVYGVADNNDWDHRSSSIGVYSLDAAIWNNHIFNFGTADNFYFENNAFTGEGVVGSGWGGRYAFRYNNITLTAHSFPTFDAHGNMGPGMGYSMMGVEIYENVIHGGSYMCRTVDLRGGRNLVYNNNLINTVSYGAQIREEFDDAGNPPTHALDGQPQHIWDTYYFGNTRNNIRMPFDSIGTFDYGARDCGEWENQGCHKGLVPTHNIHFWQQGATFDGSSGVGVGVLSERPASCTTGGVAWWATDEEKLYRCKNGIWELYYVPYTYPHPLRLEDNGEIPSDTIPPLRSNRYPTGNLSAGTNSTTMGLTTNEVATCRYSTTPGTSYNSMTNIFSTTGSTIHSQLITGLTNGNIYNYYVRCRDNSGNANSDDYIISFNVSTTDISDIVTIQDMLGAYQQYKKNEVGILYFLDKLRRWIVFW